LTLTPGTPLGPYEIVALLGAGGMGEVYRARDVKLGRDVAVKVLPESLAGDPERLARFEREAKVLAALNHPNIAHIHGFEDSTGVPALVMELVEGPTLADRIARGRIPIDDALTIARQIAEALKAAHEQGIIHRDLKPANIKVKDDGTVKVLDFGLAKALVGDRTSPDLTHSPTVTVDGTLEGIILGTAAYMSPEQARGKVVDTRTDIWAFGCVLYEMLTGRVAFPGETVSDTIAAILEREPDWLAQSEATPASIRRLLRRCLQKDSKRRLHDIADARLEFDEVDAPEGETERATHRRKTRDTVAWVLAATLGTALAAALIALYRVPRPTPSEPVRFGVSVAGRLLMPYYVEMAPDGRQLAFVATDSSGRQLLGIRTWDGRDPRLLPGTEDAGHPFWSPDSRSVGFFSGYVQQGKLKTVDVSSGIVQTVAAPAFRAGGTWSQDGTILFIQAGRGLARVSSSGGTVSPVGVQDASGRPVPGVGWPRFLPDGRHFLFFGGPQGQRGVYVGSLDSTAARFLLTTKFRAAYAPPGYLLFMRDDQALMAQPLDVRRLELTGDPSLVAEHIYGEVGTATNRFSVSSNGALAFVDQSIANTQLTWFDRGGHPLGTIGTPDVYDFETPQLSPDGHRVAVSRGPLSSEDIWLLDAVDGTSSRLTFDPAADETPLWSPDGTEIVFQSNRGDGRARVYKRRANGAGTDAVLFESAASVTLQDWSSDGRLLVYGVSGAKGHQDLWVLPTTGDRQPFPFLQTDVNESQAQVAPNGRWIAYTSDETGRSEVYVQSFPRAGSKRQVSSEGGVQPRWRRDGRELFYLTPDAELTAVAVTGEADLDIDIGRGTPLFRTQLPTWATGGPPIWRTAYAAAADGQRFLLINPPERRDSPITVVLNWQSALRARESR
jgi:Tol biopolymer transport system component